MRNILHSILLKNPGRIVSHMGKLGYLPPLTLVHTSMSIEDVSPVVLVTGVKHDSPEIQLLCVKNTSRE